MDDSKENVFEFQPDSDGSLTLEDAVYQAIGAASVCWENMHGTGVFQEGKARTIAVALLQKISEDRLPSTIQTLGHLVNIGPEAFTNGDVISYKGENFYRACDRFVTANDEEGLKSFCVKRVGHPGKIHEDYDGNTREEA